MKAKSPCRQLKLPAGAEYPRYHSDLSLLPPYNDRMIEYSPPKTERPYLQPAPEIGANISRYHPTLYLRFLIRNVNGRSCLLYSAEKLSSD